MTANEGHFVCRYCDKDIGHRDEYSAGTEVKCPECGAEYEFKYDDRYKKVQMYTNVTPGDAN